MTYKNVRSNMANVSAEKITLRESLGARFYDKCFIFVLHLIP